MENATQTLEMELLEDEKLIGLNGPEDDDDDFEDDGFDLDDIELGDFDDDFDDDDF